jgi:hypothetical protein
MKHRKKATTNMVANQGRLPIGHLLPSLIVKTNL